MRQEVRFCQTERGRVAYAVAGAGPPLLMPAWWVSHLELDWERPSFRAFAEALAERRTLVRYDTPGTGLSDRPDAPPLFTLDHQLEVLEAVHREMGVSPAALLGVSSGAGVAAVYGARHPERASQLVLYGGYPRGSEITTQDVSGSMLAVVRSHWGMGSRLLADVFLPEADAAELEDFARFQREAASAQVAAAQLASVYTLDVSAELGRVQTPALVLHRRDDRAIPYALGRKLASLVAGAQLLTLDGAQHLPWLGDSAPVLSAIGEFLDGSPARMPADVLDGDAPALSERELEVLRLVARGLADSEIAERLIVSPHTVHRHVANIRAKLREPSRAAAVAHASRLGLL